MSGESMKNRDGDDATVSRRVETDVRTALPVEHEIHEKRKQPESKSERARLIESVLNVGHCSIQMSFPDALMRKHGMPGRGGWEVLDDGKWESPPHVPNSKEKDAEQMHLGSLIRFGLWKVTDRWAFPIQGKIPEAYYNEHPIREYIACYPAVRKDQVVEMRTFSEMRMVERKVERKGWFGRRYTEVISEKIPVQEEKPIVIGYQDNPIQFSSGEKAVTVYYHAETIGATAQSPEGVSFTDDVGRRGNALDVRILLPASIFDKLHEALKDDPTIMREITDHILECTTGEHDPDVRRNVLPPYGAWDTDSSAIHGMYIDNQVHGKQGTGWDQRKVHLFPQGADTI